MTHICPAKPCMVSIFLEMSVVSNPTSSLKLVQNSSVYHVLTRLIDFSNVANFQTIFYYRTVFANLSMSLYSCLASTRTVSPPHSTPAGTLHPNTNYIHRKSPVEPTAKNQPTEPTEQNNEFTSRYTYQCWPITCVGHFTVAFDGKFFSLITCCVKLENYS